MVKHVSHYFLIAALLSCTIAYAQGLARNGSVQTSAPPVGIRNFSSARQALQAVIDARKPSNVKPAAITDFANSTRQPFSPREEFLAPALQKLTSGQSHPSENAAKQDQSLPGGMHFPGFLQASPVVRSGLDSDLSPVWASLSADLNNDGAPDLVTVQMGGQLNVVLNPGHGKLANMTLSSTNRSAVSSSTIITYAIPADLNGDGYQDVVAIDAGSNAIDVFLNRGDGTFSDAISYVINFTASYGSLPALFGGGVVLGDVNGDGALDIVAMAMDNGYPDWSLTTIELFTFLGKGDGTFLSPLPEQKQVIPLMVSNAGQMQLADVNKDGVLDLVFLAGGYDDSFNSGLFVTAAQGDGTGVFRGFPQAMPVSGAIIPGENSILGTMKVTDVDGDGNPDVLFTNGKNNLYLTLGDGAGNFGTPTTSLNSLAGAPLLNFADVTGDGKLDVVAYYNGSVAVFAGQDAGTFSSTPLVQLVSGSGGDQQPMPGDFDGDGNIDLVDIDYFLNTAGFFLGANETFRGSQILVPPGVNNQNFSAIAAADLNGDGSPDVVAAQMSNIYQRLPDVIAGLNDGHGNFTYSVAVSNSTLQNNYVKSMEPIVTDLNGDGRADLLFTTQYGLSAVFGNGDGTFDSKFHMIGLGNTLDIGCSMNYADVADLNHDGAPDIVVAYPGDASCNRTNGNLSGVFTLLNRGDGTFAPSFNPIGSAAYLPKLIDFNGDGNLDLVLANNDAVNNAYNLYVVPGKSDGTFDFSAMSVPLSNTIVESIIPGDFDKDGKQDLTVGVVTRLDQNGQPIYNTTGAELLKGNGDFTFGLPTQYAAGFQPVDGRYADFNGDGLPDLALDLGPIDLYTNIQSSGFAYLPNLGTGTFGPLVQTFSSPSQGGRMMVADFNGDGAPDVLNQAGFGPQLFLNTGAITLSLASDAAAISQGTAVTLTAKLQPSVGVQSPTGTLTVYDNGTAIETTAVSGTTTVVPLSSLAVGSHSLTATYSGDDNFNSASASTSVNVAVATLPPGISLSTPSPSSLSLAPGATGTTVVELAANSTFSGTVQLSCSGAPSSATCTVSPSTVNLGAGQSSKVTVVVATTAPNNSYQAASLNHRAPWRSGLAEFGFFAVGFVAWHKRRQVSKAVIVLGIAILIFGTVGMLVGCGGGSSKKYQYGGTSAGTYTLTITATSGSVSQSQTVPLTVTSAQ